MLPVNNGRRVEELSRIGSKSPLGSFGCPFGPEPDPRLPLMVEWMLSRSLEAASRVDGAV